MADKKLELTYDESQKKISEVFGWSDDMYTNVCANLTKFLVFASDDYEGYTEALKGFIESDLFKKTGAKLETANDFFMLGYCFKTAMNKIHSKMDKLMGGSSMLKLLKALAD